MKETNFIFDLDGTLYDLDGVPGTRFGASRFCADLMANTKTFISERLGVDQEEASQIHTRIIKTYEGELSLGLEAEYDIDRYDLFEATWGQPPEKYIGANPELTKMLAPFAGRSALLSAAPRVWVDLVLEYLEVGDVFGGQIYTGEPDLRKPNPEIFRLITKQLGTKPQNCLSIGDQNYSDIIPAKAIGMQTALIGPEQLDADFSAESLQGILEIIDERGLL